MGAPAVLGLKGQTRLGVGDPDLAQMGSCAGPRNQQYNGLPLWRAVCFRTAV